MERRTIPDPLNAEQWSERLEDRNDIDALTKLHRSAEDAEAVRKLRNAKVVLKTVPLSNSKDSTTSSAGSSSRRRSAIPLDQVPGSVVSISSVRSSNLRQSVAQVKPTRYSLRRSRAVAPDQRESSVFRESMTFAGPRGRQMRVWAFGGIHSANIFVRRLRIFHFDVTVGELLGVFAWLLFAVVWALVNRSNELRTPENAALDVTDTSVNWARVFGNMANICIAFVLLPVSRSSIWWSFFGLSFERLVVFHRLVGWLLLVMSTTHMLIWWGEWGENGVLHEYLRAGAWNGKNGIIAWVFQVVLTLCSIPIIRRRKFELFYLVHLSFPLFLFFACYHTTQYVNHLPFLILPGCTMYVIDRLLRYRNRFVSTSVAELRSLADNEVVKLSIRRAGFRYIPGQYVFLNIPALSHIEWHPFSISSAYLDPGETEPVFTIVVKAVGSWTKGLARLAALLREEHWKDLRVLVDGPYGTQLDYDGYGAVAMVCGGFGVPPMLSVLMDIFYRKQFDLHGECPRDVFFVWIARNPDHLSVYEDFFAEIAGAAPNVRKHLHFEVYLTGSGGTGGGDGLDAALLEERSDTRDALIRAQQLPGGLRARIFPGRPHLHEVLQRIAQLSHGTEHIRLLCCGPQALIDKCGTLAYEMSTDHMAFDFTSESYEW